MTRIAGFKHSLFLWALVTAITLRALVPAGFMPDKTGQHFITICHGDGQAVIAVDKDNAPLPSSPPSPDKSNESCPFAFLSASLWTGGQTSPDTLFSPLLRAEQPLPVAESHIPPAKPATQHLSRAPPSFS